MIGNIFPGEIAFQNRRGQKQRPFYRPDNDAREPSIGFLNTEHPRNWIIVSQKKHTLESKSKNFGIGFWWSKSIHYIHPEKKTSDGPMIRVLFFVSIVFCLPVIIIESFPLHWALWWWFLNRFLEGEKTKRIWTIRKHVQAPQSQSNRILQQTLDIISILFVQYGRVLLYLSRKVHYCIQRLNIFSARKARKQRPVYWQYWFPTLNINRTKIELVTMQCRINLPNKTFNAFSSG